MAETNAIEHKEPPKGLIKQTEKEKFLVELRQEERQSRREKAEEGFRRTLRELAPKRLRLSDDRADSMIQKNPQLVAELVRRRVLVPAAAECLVAAAPLAGMGAWGFMNGDIGAGIIVGLFFSFFSAVLVGIVSGYKDLRYLRRYRKLKKLSGGASAYLVAPSGAEMHANETFEEGRR